MKGIGRVASVGRLTGNDRGRRVSCRAATRGPPRGHRPRKRAAKAAQSRNEEPKPSPVALAPCETVPFTYWPGQRADREQPCHEEARRGERPQTRIEDRIGELAGLLADRDRARRVLPSHVIIERGLRARPAGRIGRRRARRAWE